MVNDQDKRQKGFIKNKKMKKRKKFFYATYTLSFHFYGLKHAQNHFDLFLDIDEASPLVTYKLKALNFRKQKIGFQYPMSLSNPHRRKYLTYQGKISRGKGKIRILKRKSFKLPPEFDITNPPHQFLFSF